MKPTGYVMVPVATVLFLFAGQKISRAESTNDVFLSWKGSAVTARNAERIVRLAFTDVVTWREDKTSENEKMMMVRLPLDNSGKEIVLLTKEGDVDGKLGNIWEVFVLEGSTFRLLKGVACLSPDEPLVLKVSVNAEQARLFFVHSYREDVVVCEEPFADSDFSDTSIVIRYPRSQVKGLDDIGIVSLAQNSPRSKLKRLPILTGKPEDLQKALQNKQKQSSMESISQ